MGSANFIAFHPHSPISSLIRYFTTLFKASFNSYSYSFFSRPPSSYTFLRNLLTAYPEKEDDLVFSALSRMLNRHFDSVSLNESTYLHTYYGAFLKKLVSRENMYAYVYVNLSSSLEKTVSREYLLRRLSYVVEAAVSVFQRKLVSLGHANRLRCIDVRRSLLSDLFCSLLLTSLLSKTRLEKATRNSRKRSKSDSASLSR